MAKKDDVLKDILERLTPLGSVSHRSMFGGFGLFMDGAMFAKISPKGVLSFKADDQNRSEFEKQGMKRAGKMPYYDVKSEDLTNTRKLRAWARSAMTAAQNAKK
jgi:DNA transformation protein